MLPCQILSAPSPQRNDLSSSVSFSGWRLANMKFKRWARKMSALHEPIWRKAGIFEAVNASTYKIHKNTEFLVLLRNGFSVLGSPAFATLDSSGKKIMERLKNAWQTIKREACCLPLVAWLFRVAITLPSSL
ncbi:unnamed protein product [Arabidopsis thaliana]|uniref:Uncharacterized protein n=1 Tax=Arabidopsis thaliana TaxID=3702 RepID=A0A5S9WKQ0_ARATH|nr:unnamed protein product [Arabidopsis thaliana]